MVTILSMAVSVPGTLLAGRYRLIERLGSGGMATVFLAEDERLGRRVAVKRLHADSPSDTAKRFSREARLGASLNHPNVVTVYDAVNEGEAVLIAMEYVDGGTLADALRDGAIKPERAAEVIAGVAAALDHAHDQGIVHRDVKPANILLGEGGKVKLVDLGIATALEGTRITSSNSVMGTAAYMAPEQLDGRDAGPRADVYALAVVAYEALTGKRAYRGTSPVEVAHQVVDGPPPDLLAAWPEAPPAAADVLTRAMAFDPEDRPASAGALARELAGALRSGGGEARPDPTMALPRTTSQNGEDTRRRRRDGSATAAGNGAGLATGNGGGPAPTPPAQPARTAPPEPAYRRQQATGRRKIPGALIAVLALAAVAVVAVILILSAGGSGGSGDNASSSSQSHAARLKKRRAARALKTTPAPAQAAPSTAPQATTPAQPSTGSGASGGGSSYSVPQPSGSDAEKGAALQTRGHALADSNPAQAIPVLERSVRSFPAGTNDIRYAYALFDLGHALRLANRPQDAIPVLEERLKIDNQRATVQHELDAAKAAAKG
ncbi:MAG: eukaryotic-like serine/threonine-protein kinase [Thermoleophilaceae bacterium]|nr:eukaryotic-like serine/threonine-protein kinase [Thermoleophilaceae bacterium]